MNYFVLECLQINNFEVDKRFIRPDYFKNRFTRFTNLQNKYKMNTRTTFTNKRGVKVTGPSNSSCIDYQLLLSLIREGKYTELLKMLTDQIHNIFIPSEIVISLVQEGKSKMLKFLLERGCSANIVPSCIADGVALSGNTDMMDLLLSNGLSILLACSKETFDSLLKERHYPTVSLLVKHKILLSPTFSSIANTQMSDLILENNLLIVSLLLSNKISAQFCSESLFEEILSKGNIDMARLLLKHDFLGKDFSHFAKTLANFMQQCPEIAISLFERELVTVAKCLENGRVYDPKKIHRVTGIAVQMGNSPALEFLLKAYGVRIFDYLFPEAIGMAIRYSHSPILHRVLDIMIEHDMPVTMCFTTSIFESVFDTGHEEFNRFSARLEETGQYYPNQLRLPFIHSCVYHNPKINRLIKMGLPILGIHSSIVKNVLLLNSGNRVIQSLKWQGYRGYQSDLFRERRSTAKDMIVGMLALAPAIRANSLNFPSTLFLLGYIADPVCFADSDFNDKLLEVTLFRRNLSNSPTPRGGRICSFIQEEILNRNNTVITCLKSMDGALSKPVEFRQNCNTAMNWIEVMLALGSATRSKRINYPSVCFLLGYIAVPARLEDYRSLCFTIFDITVFIEE